MASLWLCISIPWERPKATLRPPLSIMDVPEPALDSASTSVCSSLSPASLPQLYSTLSSPHPEALASLLHPSDMGQASATMPGYLAIHVQGQAVAPGCLCH